MPLPVALRQQQFMRADPAVRPAATSVLGCLQGDRPRPLRSSSFLANVGAGPAPHHFKTATRAVAGAMLPGQDCLGPSGGVRPRAIISSGSL